MSSCSTHIVLWLDSGSERLRTSTRNRLDASAIELDCPLITYDDRITRFGERHGSQYGFMAQA
jgi:hypothetical protein